jgi:hypothetical protein
MSIPERPEKGAEPVCPDASEPASVYYSANYCD